MRDNIRARLAVAPIAKKMEAERAEDSRRADQLEARVIALEKLVATLWGLPGHPGHKEAGAADPGSVG